MIRQLKSIIFFQGNFQKAQNSRFHLRPQRNFGLRAADFHGVWLLLSLLLYNISRKTSVIIPMRRELLPNGRSFMFYCTYTI